MSKSPKTSLRSPFIAAMTVLIAVAAWYGSKAYYRFVPPEIPVRKFQISMEGRVGPWNGPAISPDGTRVAYRQRGRLWIRDLDKTDGHEIPGTDGQNRPTWSPDSDFVVYIVGNILRKRPVSEGPETIVCESTDGRFGGSTWKPDGDIVFSQSDAGLFIVSSQGGHAELLIPPDPQLNDIALYDPHVLPDGESLLFVVEKTDGSWTIEILSEGERTTVLSNAGQPIRVPVYSPTGHILYQHGLDENISIWAAPFSTSDVSATGVPFPVAVGGMHPSVSQNGTLVYRGKTTGSQQLVLIDRNGRVRRVIGESQEQIANPVFSPGGNRIALTAWKNNNPDVWVHDLNRGTMTRLTIDPEMDWPPTWAPDGERIIFTSRRFGPSDIFHMAADGSGMVQPLITGPLEYWGADWSQDGRYLIYYKYDPATGRDLWYKRMTNGSQPVIFLQTPFHELLPRFSPDGRFVAYVSNISERWEVYVKTFPEGDRQWQISVDGGVHPRWHPSGNELYYVKGNTLMSVSIDREKVFRPNVPKTLLSGEDIWTNLYEGGSPFFSAYDVTPDGNGFVVARTAEKTATMITVVQNWYGEFSE